MNRALLITLFCGLTTTAAATAEPPEIVQRSIEFHGGPLYTASTASFDICSRSGCFAVTSTMEGGLFTHTVQEAQGERQRWVRTTNDSVEVREFGRPLDVAPDQQQAWRDWVMQRVYFALLPFRLADPSVLYQDLGPTDWQGRALHRVHVTFETGSSTDASDEYMYWFDPESARLEQFAYTYVNTNGTRGLRFRRLHNYRRIGGILLFDQENLGRDDHSLPLVEVTAETVAERLRPVSQVRLEDPRITPLSATP